MPVIRKHGDLRAYSGLWTVMWWDASGKPRQKRLGRTRDVSYRAATVAAAAFIAEMQEYGDPLENRLAPKIAWPEGMRTRVGHRKECVFCGEGTNQQLLKFAVCVTCGDIPREWDFAHCIECRRRFPIMREPQNALAIIRYCHDCKDHEFVEDGRRVHAGRGT